MLRIKSVSFNTSPIKSFLIYAHIPSFSHHTTTAVQVNYLLIEGLERSHFFYGDTFKVEVPTRSGARHALLTQ